jgi:tetratricopeptide (TPR) repeat protein
MDDLLRRIEELLIEDPRAAAELVDDVLESARDEALLVSARVLCVWGGVRRVQGDWSAAEAAYLLAKHHLLIVGASPAEWIDWHSRMAFLHRDKRELREAATHAMAALELARELRAPKLLAHALVDLALVLRYFDVGRARENAEEALKLLPDDDRPYRRSALHVLIGCLCYEEEPDLDELAVRMDEARAIGDAPESFAGTKLLWFEGLTHWRQGRPGEAVPALRDAYDGLLQHGAHVNAATCALDLARVHLEAGDMGSASGVAGMLFPVLGALRHETEALSALAIFRRAATERTLTVELVQDVQGRVEGAES